MIPSDLRAAAIEWTWRLRLLAVMGVRPPHDLPERILGVLPTTVASGAVVVEDPSWRVTVPYGVRRVVTVEELGGGQA